MEPEKGMAWGQRVHDNPCLLTIHHGAFPICVDDTTLSLPGIRNLSVRVNIFGHGRVGYLRAKRTCCGALSGWVDEAGDGLVGNLLFPLLHNYVIQRVWPRRCQKNTSEISAPDPRSK